MTNPQYQPASLTIFFTANLFTRGKIKRYLTDAASSASLGIEIEEAKLPLHSVISCDFTGPYYKVAHLQTQMKELNMPPSYLHLINN